MRQMDVTCTHDLPRRVGQVFRDLKQRFYDQILGVVRPSSSCAELADDTAGLQVDLALFVGSLWEGSYVNVKSRAHTALKPHAPGATRTFLPVIRPVRIRGREVYLAEDRHERHLPQDGLMPRSGSLYLQSPEARVVLLRMKGGGNLLRLEAVLREVDEVLVLEERTRLREPFALLFR